MRTIENRPVRRYLAFHYLLHYPVGGWGDALGSFDTPAEAFEACDRESRYGDTCVVIDMQTGHEIERPVLTVIVSKPRGAERLNAEFQSDPAWLIPYLEGT